MKLKIYQQGGGLIYTPFIPEQYTGTASKSAKGSGSDEDSKIDPLDKELLGLMKDQNLLPSDIQMIFDRLISFQRRTQSLSSSMLGGSSSYRSVMPGMLQIMNYLSQAKYSKAADDKIVNQMMNENAGNEFALDGYGRMYVMTEDGKVTKIAPSSFDNEKHRPLSNSELLYLRENKPELALDTEIFDDMRNMVGMSSVSKEIERIIKAFGTEEGQRYLSKETAQIFSDLNNPDGAYKLTMKVPASGLKEAWKTIYDQLPTNMQNLIKIRAAVSGDTKETFISDIVLHNSSTTQNIDYDATMSKAAGYETDPLKAKKEAAEQLTQNNYLQQIGNMRLHTTRTTIVPRAAKIFDTAAMSVSAYNAGAPVDKQMDVLPKMSLADFRIKANAAKAGDFNSVTFGNRILHPTEYDKVMYDGSSEINIVMLPYKRDSATGKLMPDFGKMEAFNEAANIIRNNPNMSQTELQQLLSSKGLSINDISDTLELTDTMPFITISAYGSKDSNTITKDMEPYLEHLESGVGKDVADAFKNMLIYGTTEPSKNSRKISKQNTPERRDIYRGNIFIPMENSARAMLLSGIGEYVPKTDMMDFAARVEAREQEAALNSYLKQNDPNYDVISQLGQFR